MKADEKQSAFALLFDLSRPPDVGFPVGRMMIAARYAGGMWMKVAIMGAGLSGLACAGILKRNGVEPVVFELRHRVGERFPNVESLAGLIQRPWMDAFAYFARLGLPLRPTAPLQRLIVHGPSCHAFFQGRLGHITVRGHWPDSWERSLAAQVDSRILFNHDEDWRNLARDFDRVVVATGDAIIPESLGLWRRTVDVHIKGAVLRGRFDPNQVEMWFNTRYAKTGYCYFGPFDHRHACAAVALPDSTPAELDEYFERFMGEAGITGRVMLDFKTEGYPIGVCAAHQRDNVLFIGNAGGFIDSAFGFGQFDSIAAGIMAGRAIAGGLDYEKLLKRYIARMQRFLRIRRLLDRLDNDDYDRLVRVMGTYPAQRAVFGTRIDWFGLLGRLLGPGRMRE